MASIDQDKAYVDGLWITAEERPAHMVLLAVRQEAIERLVNLGYTQVKQVTIISLTKLS